jgi:hypothetical protein
MTDFLQRLKQRKPLQRRLPGVLAQRHGGTCRGELLVELDGWRYA